jgi:serine/threonine protein kinase
VAVSIEQFGKALAASGLMTADDVRALWGAIPAGERPKDGEAFGKLLVEQKKLTSFQAAEILAGRGARLIMGEYSLLAEIGAGGMGAVYKAQHRRMKRVVALKVMSGAAMRDEAAVKRFQREVQAAARLEHPNIVTAYDSGEAGNVKYLVMQFVDGGDLSDLVKKNGRCSVEQAVDYVLQAAKGLAFAHGEGVIHRDIKPANLLLDKKGIVKILDMGLARIEGGDDGLTATEQVMGTVDYMSPEQAANTKTADARADIYSLGCTLWFLLTARKVYESDSMIGRLMAHRDGPLPSLVKTRDDVPWALEQAFHKMIAKRPQDRFQTMAEVTAALEPFGGGSSSSGGSRSGSGSSSGTNAELASFMKSMGNSPTTAGGMTKGGASTSQAKPAAGSKTSIAAQIDATAQFDKSEAETDPRSEVLPAGAAVAPAAAPQPRPAAKKTKGPPPKNVKLIAGGLIGAALLLVAGIIVTVRDKDGNVVAEVNVPNGASVEVKSTPAVPTPAAPPAAAISAAEAQRNRAAAEWCFSTGIGYCDIVSAGNAAFVSTLVQKRSELPREPFYVLRLCRDTGGVSSLQEVSGLTRLRELLLKNTRLSDAVFRHLIDLPNLETLGLAGTSLTDDSLKSAVNRFKTLRVLDLRGVNGITDAGLKHLSQLPNLDHVQLTGTSATAAGVADLRKALPRCLVDWTEATNTITPQPATPSATIASTPSTAGWTSLFNGRDLTGWTPQGYNGWTVAGGELVGRTTANSPGWLMSDAEYDDFEFEGEYKLGPDSNSGVFFRAWPEGKVSGGDFQELQLLDDNSPKFSNTRSNARTGAIYGFAAPSPEVRPPAGQWHKFRLAVFKDNARIWINGVQVVATQLADGKRARGRLGFQLYPDEVSFRNLRVRELNSDGTARAPSPPPQTPAAAASGGYALQFDGNSLVETPNIAAGNLREFTIEAYALSDEAGPVETSQFIADIFKRSALHRYKGRWELTTKYDGILVPEYARDTGPSPPRRWDHLAGVVREDAMHFYVNGKKVASKTFVNPLDSRPADKFEIGKRFLGSIREVRISKTPRYDADFVPRPRFEADPDTLALYHCDEGTGNVLKDSSGRELHGKIDGATWVKAAVANSALPAAAGSDWIDVLPLIDVKQDKFTLVGLTGKNEWRIENGELHYHGDDKYGKLLWPITLLGPAMEFEVEFTRLNGNQGFNLDIPAAAGPCAVVFHTNTVGRAAVGHTKIPLPGDCTITTGKRTKVGLRITRQGPEDVVEVTWDGNLVGTWRGDRESIAAKKQDGYRHDRHQGFWIPSLQHYVFHTIRARPLQGGTIEPTRRSSGAASAPVPSSGPAATPAASTAPLFNGVDLTGWTGKPGVWKWEAGELVGTLSAKDVTYLAGSKPYRDFDLSYEVKTEGAQGNAGVQFRSSLYDSAPFSMTGPQVEIGGDGKTGYGGLWWQSGARNGVVAAVPPEKFRPLLKTGDYNLMTVRAVGKHVTITLNGTTTVDGEFDIPADGLLGWQLVSYGGPVTTRFRNIVFRDLSGGAESATSSKGSPIDLLAAIQIPRDVVAGNWTKQGSMLVTTRDGGSGNQSRLYLSTPGPVPAEYDVELVVERTEDSGTGLVLGFVMGGRQATANFDSYSGPARWGIETINGENMRLDKNPTRNDGMRLKRNERKTIRLEVRTGGVRVFCDADKVVDWQGRADQLGTSFWDVPNKQSLFLGSQTVFHIQSIRLTPLGK